VFHRVRQPHNKGMNLTSALPRFARWHGRRSQVMPGVGPTPSGNRVAAAC
jgi:hypothetical protein